MFEQVFGFWGIFLSFPALYVASKIAGEWKLEDKVHTEAAVQARTSQSTPPTQTPIPANRTSMPAPSSTQTPIPTSQSQPPVSVRPTPAE